MSCKLFVFRHTETTDNRNEIFSGWRDPDLTPKGVAEAQEIAKQLQNEEIDCAFTSHLKRARRTLDIVLQPHLDVPVFVDDRLIERCYGILQGKSKTELAAQNPEWFAKVHRGYVFSPPKGESLKMVETRVMPFVLQLKEWLRQNPCNLAIACHSNSIRPIRRVFEHLSLEQMVHIETPPGQIMKYTLQTPRKENSIHEEHVLKTEWQSVVVPPSVELASDPKNPLKKYYQD